MKGQVSLVVLVPWEIMKGFSLCDRTQFLVGLETTRVTEAAFTLLKVVERQIMSHASPFTPLVWLRLVAPLRFPFIITLLYISGT